MGGLLSDLRDVLKGNVLVLTTSWILMNLGGAMIYPYESPFLRELGATPYVIGIIGSVCNIALFIVRIPGSYIADKYGRRQIIVTMTFSVGATYLLISLAPDWRYVFAALIVQNLCLIYQPALYAIEADSVPADKRGMGFTLIRVVSSIPNIFGPIIAGIIVTNLGLVSGMRLAYFITFILFLIAALTRVKLKETLPDARPIKLSEIKVAFRSSLKSMADSLVNAPRKLKIVIVIITLSVTEEPIFRYFMSLYAFDRIGLTKLEWSTALSVNAFVSILSGIPMGKFIDKYGRRTSLATLYLTLPLLTLLFIFSQSIHGVLLVFLLFGILGHLFNAFSALIADLTPIEHRGRIAGAIGNVEVIGTSIASYLSGLLYQIDPSYPFILTIALDILILILIVKFVK